MDYTAHIKRAERLRELAASIRTKQNDREAIAEGFELVACAMEPCIDCGKEGETRTVEALEKIESAWAENGDAE